MKGGWDVGMQVDCDQLDALCILSSHPYFCCKTMPLSEIALLLSERFLHDMIALGLYRLCLIFPRLHHLSIGVSPSRVSKIFLEMWQIQFCLLFVETLQHSVTMVVGYGCRRLARWWNRSKRLAQNSKTLSALSGASKSGNVCRMQ